MYGGTCMFFQTGDSAKFLAGYEKSTAAMVDIIKKNPASNYPMQQLSRKKIDGRDVLVVTIDMSKTIEKQTEKQPQLKGMMESMFGKDGKLTAYITAADKEVVVMAYDEDVLKKAVADVKE